MNSGPDLARPHGLSLIKMLCIVAACAAFIVLGLAILPGP